MEANLKYKQRAIVFSDLTTSTLDHLDGLTIKHGAWCAAPALPPLCITTHDKHIIWGSGLI
jgi:hypothetical protein